MKTWSFILIGVLSVPVFGAELTLSQLQQTLSQRGISWGAGETSVSGLSTGEQKRLLGLDLGEDHGDYFFSREKSPLRLPAHLDWRDVNGVSYASPILDQGRCGSCAAFAAVGTLETLMNIKRKTPNSPWAFSPQHLFSCGVGKSYKVGTHYAVSGYLEESGIPDEACFPYTSGATGADAACSNTCSNAAERSLKITGSNMPTFLFVSVDRIKEAVANGPIVAAMVVYEDFFYYKSGVYQHVTGDKAGGHAVSVIGWDDTEESWIVRNSWGPDWGDKGFFRIKWKDASNLGMQSLAFEVPESDTFVTLGGLRDYTVLNGTTTLGVQSTFPGTTKIDYTVKKGTVPLFTGGAQSPRAITLDTTKFADGMYTIVATAQYPGGTGTSQPRHISILNGTLHGSLKFTSVKPNDVLKGSAVLDLELVASPVNFNRVTFYAKNKASGESLRRSTTNTANKMAIGWRTSGLPNGSYDIWLDATAGNTTVTSDVTPVKLQN